MEVVKRTYCIEKKTHVHTSTSDSELKINNQIESLCWQNWNYFFSQRNQMCCTLTMSVFWWHKNQYLHICDSPLVIYYPENLKIQGIVSPYWFRRDTLRCQCVHFIACEVQRTWLLEQGWISAWYIDLCNGRKQINIFSEDHMRPTGCVVVEHLTSNFAVSFTNVVQRGKHIQQSIGVLDFEVHEYEIWSRTANTFYGHSSEHLIW